MGFPMVSLLVHSESVPSAAREALRFAIHAAPELRAGALRKAAEILFAETDLECAEVKALVGITDGVCAA